MRCAYGHPDQETPSENYIIFTPNFNFCAKQFTHHDLILQYLLTTTRIAAGGLAQVVECLPSNR
jgi:hypothetical protein